MLDLIAAIPTTDQVDAWYAVIERIVGHLGNLAIIGLAIWAKVESSANSRRLDRQGATIKEVTASPASAEVVKAIQQQTVALATPVPPAPTKTVDAKALAKALVAEAMAAAKPPAEPPAPQPPRWPIATPNLPVTQRPEVK